MEKAKQAGQMSNVPAWLAVSRASAMMPIVFCASFVHA